MTRLIVWLVAITFLWITVDAALEIARIAMGVGK